MFKEISKMEQRYDAVLMVIRDGFTVTEVATKVGVSRQSIYAWMAHYEAEGLEGLKDRSHRPHVVPHQTAAEIEEAVVELPVAHPRQLAKLPPESLLFVARSISLQDHVTVPD